MTIYGDITPRTAAFAVKEMLKRGMPYLVFEKFGQTYTLPTNSTKVAKFRRYFLVGSTGAAGAGNNAAPWSVPLSTAPLAEGVTPAGLNLTNQDYTITLNQYGDFTTISDVIEDTHEDPVLQQATEVLGEQAALTVETIRYNVLKAGVNVFYNGSVGSRLLVGSSITLANQRSVTTAMNRQNAKKITSVVKSTPNFQTFPIGASYIAIVHPDMETDIRSLSGFTPVERYGTLTPFENEIGWVEQVRYLSSTVVTPFTGAGATMAATSTASTIAGTLLTIGGTVTGTFTVGSVIGGGTTAAGTVITALGTGTGGVGTYTVSISQTVTSAALTGTISGIRNTAGVVDVYPVLFFGRDAYGLVPLKGATSLTPMVVNPKPSVNDPLGQRGTVGWKTMQGAIILNDAWMARYETGASS